MNVRGPFRSSVSGESVPTIPAFRARERMRHLRSVAGRDTTLHQVRLSRQRANSGKQRPKRSRATSPQRQCNLYPPSGCVFRSYANVRFRGLLFAIGGGLVLGSASGSWPVHAIHGREDSGMLLRSSTLTQHPLPPARNGSFGESHLRLRRQLSGVVVLHQDDALSA
jgi:hypothetical protein